MVCVNVSRLSYCYYSPPLSYADIREVLKDLQQLSASLLGLEQTGSK